jgi:type II secretory pathway pseudopilin PulG
MNPQPLHRHAASRRVLNTVEALFLICLVAIFLAVFLDSRMPSLTGAKRAKAANTATQIQTAALSYYTEYSVYPTPSGVKKDYVLTDTDGAINAKPGSWGPLIECLSGMIRPTDGLKSTETIFENSRQIAFISLKKSDVDTSDRPLNPLAPNSKQLFYNIAFDTDYDGLLGDPKTTSAGLLPDFSVTTKTGPLPTTGTSTAGVAVWANCNPPGSTNSNWYVHTY